MQVVTKAIVLDSIKYGDSSLIVRCYTELYGIKSYLLKGILKRKKGKVVKSQFLPLSILQVNASHNNKSVLNSITEARVVFPYVELHTDLVKQSLVYFLAETLSSCLQQEEEDKELYAFLEASFLWLDSHDKIANYHITFLFLLTKYLGFYPDVSENHLPYFDLASGCYSSVITSDYFSKRDMYYFNKGLGINFDSTSQELMNRQERTTILNLILRYYSLHIENFKKPKSLDVLVSILD